MGPHPPGDRTATTDDRKEEKSGGDGAWTEPAGLQMYRSALTTASALIRRKISSTSSIVAKRNSTPLSARWTSLPTCLLRRHAAQTAVAATAHEAATASATGEDFDIVDDSACQACHGSRELPPSKHNNSDS